MAQRGQGKSSSTQDQGQSAGQGEMTVREAGHKGGQRVRELIQEGKEAEGMGRSAEEEE